jgi:hypothetical protein
VEKGAKERRRWRAGRRTPPRGGARGVAPAGGRRDPSVVRRGAATRLSRRASTPRSTPTSSAAAQALLPRRFNPPSRASATPPTLASLAPRRMTQTATYVCHVVTGHGFRPVWTCSGPEHRLGTSVTHFVSSWTGLTQQHKFEVRWCILLKK